MYMYINYYLRYIITNNEIEIVIFFIHFSSNKNYSIYIFFFCKSFMIMLNVNI